MTKRIFHSICIVAMVVFLSSVVLFMGVLYRYFSDAQRNQLKMQTELASQGVAHEGIVYFKDLHIENYRVTWIDADGSVLYDSKSDSTEMENHLQRQEIKQAFANGFGESSRYSSTLMERFLYCAQRLEDGTVLRLSVAQSSLLNLSLEMLLPIGIIFVIAIAFSHALAFGLSKKIVQPLNELNLDEPLKNEGYQEISPLLGRIEAQQSQIKKQRDELLRKQNELEIVTTGMAEGIVLLNSKRTILSINPAAAKLFGAENSCVGKHILSVSKNLELQSLLLKAGDGQHSEVMMEIDNNKYRVHASPVISDGQVSGTVLLILDVTEKEKSEQMRREFTANVSHELKTPLHTISGCAELLANGMVKQEDIAKFSGQIYTETGRLIQLVEDTIKLSHLDEGADNMSREEVNLYQLAKENIESLSEEAKMAKVQVNLQGEDAAVYGIRQLLQAIIYNLLDNAIKYNEQGGTVTITVKNEEKYIRLMVADTGIGIPPEHQKRVFERFYRVDKSHSKAIGGTGLGLSIVKHAARLHSAAIELHSVIGEGTMIEVSFPKTHE